MAKKSFKFHFTYHVFTASESLNEADCLLLEKARSITSQAYAPYSHFLVGAAAMLENGEIIFGTNQENASYPVGICAERVLLSVAAMEHPGIPITAMAISYRNLANPEAANHPITPCGMCRQYMGEYEQRVGRSIRLILAGQSGLIYVIEKAGQLLPFSFNAGDLNP